MMTMSPSNNNKSNKEVEALTKHHCVASADLPMTDDASPKESVTLVIQRVSEESHGVEGVQLAVFVEELKDQHCRRIRH